MIGFGKKQMISLINSYWPESHKSNRDMKKIKKDYEIIKSKEKLDFYLTDQIYSDLSMDEVYEKVDRTNSTPGEAMLMHTINSPIFDKERLEERDKNTDKLIKNNQLRDELNYLLFKLGREGKGDVLSFILGNKKRSILKEILYTIIGTIPVITILLAIFMDVRFLAVTILIYCVNMGIHYEIEDKYELMNVPYLDKLIKTLGKIKDIKDPEFKELREEASRIHKSIGEARRYIFFLSKSEKIDSIIDIIFIVFLLQERQYYKFIRNLPRFKDSLYEGYKFIGELDVYCSTAALRKGLDYYCKPTFIEKKEIEIEEGYHVLLKKPISNSIKVDKTGAIITGSNMSGKSTFLKMIALNCLFAQTLYTCFGKSYKGDLCYIMTSLNPKEDISNNTSYYLGEAKAILNIIEEKKNGKNVVCFIDEIFRGTNPLDRISASRALLKYFHKENMLSLISTHDIEITQSFEGIYNFYHLEDDVSKERGLIFDYKVKEGIGTKSNAIKLLEYLGYPEYITDESNTILEELRSRLS